MTAKRHISETTPLPEDFTRRIREQFPGDYSGFLSALDKPPMTSIRRNPHKWNRIRHQPERLSAGPTSHKADAETKNHGPADSGSTDSGSTDSGSADSGSPVSPVPWSQNGWFLPERPSFTLDPLFHAGAYYVQEASSMFLEHVLSLPWLSGQSGVVLDACAAPGGKTTLIAAQYPESLIVSNEVIRSRVPVLMENSIKWGTGNIAITQNDPSRFKQLPGFFDLIVADTPCSGEGLFRKDPGARLQWSSDNAHHCAMRQRSILTDLWESLRPGGHLVYTTCTFHPGENEQNVAWLLKQTGGVCREVPLDSFAGEFDTAASPTPPLSEYITQIVEKESSLLSEENRLRTSAGSVSGNEDRNPAGGNNNGNPVIGYGFYPHYTDGEGFFLSAIHKPAESKRRKVSPASPPGKGGRSRSHDNITALPDAIENEMATWFTGEGFAGFRIRDHAYRIRSAHTGLLRELASVLTIRYAGTRTGKIIRNELNPTAAAALDIHLDSGRFPRIDCTREEALAFLRRENLPVPENAQKGWHLAVYNGLPLGWLKNIGNRMNNYHPKEWRITCNVNF